LTAARYVDEQEFPPGIAVSAVDSISARRDIADAFARRTINAGVDGLRLHVSSHGFGDGFACLYCPYVDLSDAVDELDSYVQLTGLSEVRVAELLRDEPLSIEDVAALFNGARIGVEQTTELVGARLRDVARLRLYAAARLPGPAAPGLGAAFVSAMAGAILAAEALKSGVDGGSLLVDRRVDIDLSGFPTGFVSKPLQDKSGRCVCADPSRVSHWRETWEPRA
jgi:hypothetical protein